MSKRNQLVRNEVNFSYYFHYCKLASVLSSLKNVIGGIEECILLVFSTDLYTHILKWLIVIQLISVMSISFTDAAFMNRDWYSNKHALFDIHMFHFCKIKSYVSLIAFVQCYKVKCINLLILVPADYIWQNKGRAGIVKLSFRSELPDSHIF